MSATGYELDRLSIQHRRLDTRAEDLRNELNRLGKAPAIRKQAIDAGLGPLPEPDDHPGPLATATSMLGRTDSRTRALLLLIAFVVVAGSLGARLAYWQVVRADELSAMAVKQSSMRYEIPSERGSIYDRTGTVVLATSVSRDLLAANPKLLEPQRRAEVAAKLVELLGLEGEPAEKLTARMTSEKEYVVLARDLEPGDLRPDPGDVRRQGPRAVRPDPRAPAGPPLPAGRRRARHDPRRPSPRLRQPRGCGPVRRGAVLPGRPGRPEDGGRRPARCLGQRGPGHLDGARGGLPGPEPHAHHRRVAPGRGGAGAPVGLDRRPREAGVRGGDGSLHGRGRRLRELSLVRRQRLPGHRGRGPRRLRGPDRVHGVRARLRVQDDDRRPPRWATGR